MRSKQIEEHKKTLKLTKKQKEILVGLILGDGHLETLNKGKTYRLKSRTFSKTKRISRLVVFKF